MPRMSASEAFVETLVANGVTDVFGIVGSAYMDALDLFPPAGIRFWSVAHEQNAAHMADGYSRASGRPGVCIAQNGPGVTNLVTAVAAGSPSVASTGPSAARRKRSWSDPGASADSSAISPRGPCPVWRSSTSTFSAEASRGGRSAWRIAFDASVRSPP